MGAFDPMLMKAKVIEGMIESLRDKDEERSLRIQSARTLGSSLERKGTDEGALEARAVEALTQSLKDEDEELREAAREALGKIKAKS